MTFDGQVMKWNYTWIYTLESMVDIFPKSWSKVSGFEKSKSMNWTGEIYKHEIQTYLQDTLTYQNYIQTNMHDAWIIQACHTNIQTQYIDRQTWHTNIKAWDMLYCHFPQLLPRITIPYYFVRTTFHVIFHLTVLSLFDEKIPDHWSDQCSSYNIN